MRLIHNVPFTPAEMERESAFPSLRPNLSVTDAFPSNGFADYRQLIFSNIINGMRTIIDTMDIWEMRVEDDNRVRLHPSLRHQSWGQQPDHPLACCPFRRETSRSSILRRNSCRTSRFRSSTSSRS